MKRSGIQVTSGRLPESAALLPGYITCHYFFEVELISENHRKEIAVPIMPTDATIEPRYHIGGNVPVAPVTTPAASLM
jgi:hypothetical protein